MDLSGHPRGGWGSQHQVQRSLRLAFPLPRLNGHVLSSLWVVGLNPKEIERWSPLRTHGGDPARIDLNPGGTLVEPYLRAAPDHPGAYLGLDPKAFSCWGKNTLVQN